MGPLLRVMPFVTDVALVDTTGGCSCGANFSITIDGCLIALTVSWFAVIALTFGLIGTSCDELFTDAMLLVVGIRVMLFCSICCCGTGCVEIINDCGCCWVS